MLRRLVLPDKHHGNIPAIAFRKLVVFVDVHFSQHTAEFLQQRLHHGLGFVAKWKKPVRAQERRSKGPLVIAGRFVGADGFVRYVTGATLHAIVDAEGAD